MITILTRQAGQQAQGRRFDTNDAVDFVVVGGIAATLLGSARDTFDVEQPSA